jgi:hypothetical protein
LVVGVGFAVWPSGDRRLEQSQTAGRKLRRGRVTQLGMRTGVVVFMAVILGQPFGLGQRTDLLDVEEIVAQAAVEALDVGFFPRCAGVYPLRQRSGVHRQKDPLLDPRARVPNSVHSARRAVGKHLCGKLPCPSSLGTSESRTVLQPLRSQCGDQHLGL